jgi:hypothetical protein
VPLSKNQGAILQLLAAHRNPESYIAGSTPLHRDGPRYSGDQQRPRPDAEIGGARKSWCPLQR